jgi:hypothetical protein
VILLLAACTTSLEDDDLCKEVGYAIAGRTQECTGDADAAQSRFEALDADYSCVAHDPTDTADAPGDTGRFIQTQDLYACPLAIRNLPCELVDDYADDLDRWLTASPICQFIVERR